MRDVHLLVAIHGMFGLPSHVSTAAQIIQDTFSAQRPEADTDFEVLLAETNRELNTYDGIDWCAERVVMDRKSEVEKDGSRRVTRFSVFGYSLGGLVARYAIAILYSQNFFKTVAPANFTTFATPHIGLVADGTMWSKMVKFFGSRLLSRTGEQFHAMDKWSPDGEPLLLAMSVKDKIFYKALCSFPNLRIYANGINDSNVPFVTAYITAHDPFVGYPDSGLQVEYDAKYRPLLTSYHMPAEPPPPKPPLPLYKRFSISSLPLPNFLHRGMPFSLLVIVLLPILMPILAGLVLLELAINSRASKRRIKILERDAPAATLWREVHQKVGETVADIVENPTGALEEVVASQSHTGTRAPSPANDAEGGLRSAAPQKQKGAPVLTLLQHQIVANLNSIPHLKKHIAFVPHYLNSHALIVCRDPAQFPSHEEGKGVLRHWADRFEF